MGPDLVATIARIVVLHVMGWSSPSILSLVQSDLAEDGQHNLAPTKRRSTRPGTKTAKVVRSPRTRHQIAEPPLIGRTLRPDPEADDVISPVFPDFDGASVFITGGGSGIGASLTEGFLRQGARVAFIGRSDATAFVARMEAETGRAPLFVQGDVTDITTLRAAMDRAAEAHGPVTRLVNNAANDQRHATLDVDEAFYDWSTAINMKAYFFACQHAIRGMKALGYGHILNFSSISYMMGNAGYAVYTSSNAAITGMTRSLAREFGPDGIRVNALAPGWVLTERQLEKWASPESLDAFLDRQCLKTHLQPADIVTPALFLCSDASRMMTGQLVAVDAGVVTTG